MVKRTDPKQMMDGFTEIWSFVLGHLIQIVTFMLSQMFYQTLRNYCFKQSY